MSDEEDEDLEIVPSAGPPPAVMGAQGEQRWRTGRPRWVKPSGRSLFDWRQYEVADISRGTPKWEEALEFVRAHHYARELPVVMFVHGLFYKNPVKDPLRVACPNVACLAPAGRSCVRGDFCDARTSSLFLVGVAIYSVPAGKTVKISSSDRAHPASIASVFPGGMDEALELGRFVLYSSVGYDGETWFLARSREFLFRRGYRGFISFSDPMQWVNEKTGVVIKPGHYGQIYQGSNAIYLGTSKPDKAWVLPDWSGSFHRTSLSKLKRGARTWKGVVEKLVRAGAKPPRSYIRDEFDPEEIEAWLERWLPRIAREVRTPGKHKFVFIDPKEEAEWRRIERLRRTKPERILSLPPPKKLIVPYPEGRDVWPSGRRAPTSMARYGEEYPKKP